MKSTSKMLKALLIGGIIFSLVLAIAAPGTAQTWIQLTPSPDPQYGSPQPRVYHSAVYNPTTNRMIVFGGSYNTTSSGCGYGCGPLNDVWVLSNADGSEPSIPAWIKINSSGGPSPREGTVAVYDQVNNRMIVHAGYTMPGYCEGVVNDTWVLTNADGTGGTPTWIPLSNQGPSLRFHKGAYDAANNRLIVQGGAPSGCGSGTNDTWVLTYANGLGGDPVWTKLEPASTPPSDKYFTVGAGYDPASNTLIAFTERDFLESWVWVLNNANGLGGAPAWTELAPSGVSPSVRWNPGTVYDGNKNRMVIFGGHWNWNVLMNDAWRLENANGQGGAPQWTLLNPTGTPPEPRGDGSAVYNPGTDRMIIFGGGNANSSSPSMFGDVWVLTEAMGPPPIINVSIDIKPGSFPNSINLSSAGVIPVAILSSSTFDATTINPETVGLAGASVKIVGKSGKFLCHEEDVNGDGLLDLICQVITAQFMIEEGQSVAVLEAETFDGTKIRGEDSVSIVP